METHHAQSSFAPIEPIDTPHALEPQAIKTKLQTTKQGITGEQAKARLEALGRNALPKAKPPNLIMRFFKQCHHLLIYVLLGASVVTLFLGHLIDTVVILAVVIVNALIGLIQEGKADQALKAIQGLLSLKAQVIRDAKIQTIDAEEIVLGDVVVLSAGDRVPADGRLI
ncbi:MAG TPA: cation-transporting P-type ATPase, partial [Wenzhouxiangella sp.]